MYKPTKVIEKVLLWDIVSMGVTTMDNPYRPGLITPPKSRKGAGRLQRHRGARWTPVTNRVWDCEADLNRAFGRALMMAAAQNTGGTERMLSVAASNVMSFLEYNPGGLYAYLMHPSEAEAWGYTAPKNPIDPWVTEKVNFHLMCLKTPPPVYTLKELPKKTIFGLAAPENMGFYSMAYPEKGDPVQVLGEFAINPLYVQGVRRVGKIV